LELHTSSWFSVFIGQWYRRENNKRLYIGYFKQPGLSKQIRFLWYRLFYTKIVEPEIINNNKGSSSTLYVFDKIFREYDFFKEVRPYRSLIKQGLLEMLAPSIKESYLKFEKPVIAIHVRRGDFKITGNISSIDYFTEVIEVIRKFTGKLLPVTVFTDANTAEIQRLLDLPEVKLAERKADIIDILLLADSKILVMSLNSTFSYWGAFLNENIIIKDPREWHVPFHADHNGKEINWSTESFYKSDEIKRKLCSIV
jgi:hypothetical protein